MNRGNRALLSDPHWTLVNGLPDFGDVVAGGKNHVAIVIDEGRQEFILTNGKK